MTYLEPGDTVRWCDDPNRRGVVLSISATPRRDMTGAVHDEWSRMVLVDWQPNTVGRTARKHWEAPELLVKVEP